ncbi:non-ribosomal peptide synthetase [Micromonospora sp. KC723]|uniref:non-ribosomal peptide synthetase n=1 Tax=Micromonospora sp. KC723 TaxID=2530381 RepID=UPI00104ED246|nr:non-ribosomal peptide synthetase [Micromonospora sp. KC723]TDB70272.1 amino acid adenylation domain-containing protein [Micromonospora sp. KC723]
MPTSQAPARDDGPASGAAPATSVIALLERVVARAPEAPALVEDGMVTDYRSLWRDVGAMAGTLVRDGVRAGEPVGVTVRRSATGIGSLLAVLRAGAAYVPLDPTDPPDRLRDIVRTCDLRRILLAAPLLPAVTAGFPVRTIESAPGPGAGGAPVGPAPEAAGDGLAYVIHTSGSTGPAKGVLVGHRALATAATALTEAWRIAPGDRILSFAALTWDTSGEEIYPCLIGGATLVIDRRATDGTVAGLLAAVAANGVTVVDLPTSFWYEVVEFLRLTGQSLPPSLRLVVIGGEEVAAGPVRTWCELVPDRVRLVNTYGQTETVLVTHQAELGGAAGRDLPDGVPVPIGRPLPHVRQVLVPTAPGARTAELYVGGPSLSFGYQARPTETAERFGPVPGAGGERMFRTGDLVTTGPDGQLGYVGRVDRQLKVRGHRVEPEAVERALLGHPALVAAAVHGTGAADTGRQLAAAVVPRSGVTLAGAELAAWLRDRLPGHLVPTRWSVHAALPLLPNGKVDHAALATAGRGGACGTPETAGDPVVAEVTAIFGRVLDRAHGPDDDFFDAGGDSLLAARLISRLYRRYDVELTFVDLFEWRTPRGLAGVLRRGDRAPDGEPAGGGAEPGDG